MSSCSMLSTSTKEVRIVSNKCHCIVPKVIDSCFSHRIVQGVEEELVFSLEGEVTIYISSISPPHTTKEYLVQLDTNAYTFSWVDEEVLNDSILNDLMNLDSIISQIPNSFNGFRADGYWSDRYYPGLRLSIGYANAKNKQYADSLISLIHCKSTN